MHIFMDKFNLSNAEAMEQLNKQSAAEANTIWHAQVMQENNMTFELFLSFHYSKC